MLAYVGRNQNLKDLKDLKNLKDLTHLKVMDVKLIELMTRTVNSRRPEWARNKIDLPRKALRGSISKVNSHAIRRLVDNRCPQNGCKNKHWMPPRGASRGIMKGDIFRLRGHDKSIFAIPVSL